LLAALAELLGDAATPALLGAWGEAYGFLADVLIDAERTLYDAQPSNWNGFRRFRVARTEVESAEIRSVYLEPCEDDLAIRHRPGQFLTVRFPHPDAGSTMRNYSISSAPAAPLRISVKAETGDVDGWVSTHVHRLEVGDEIEVGPPCGDFVLENVAASHPLVFVAGGVGITPLLSMLHTAVEANVQRELVFVHAARSESVRAFDSELRQLAERHPSARVHVCLEEVDGSHTHSDDVSVGRLNASLLGELIPAEAEVYFCGPAGFMGPVSAALDALGVPADRRHHEFFGPASELS
jgi:nitric oxide dioxygenase